MDPRAEAILDFWLDAVGRDGWYATDEALDAEIRSRFLELWEAARRGDLDGWIGAPRTCLALAILLDQFPRNMFRGDGQSFASDAKALAVAKSAIARGFDERIDMPARQFFYLPLMHSEVLADQDRSVRLFTLTPECADNLKHARAHRAVIRRFGRFPYRNAALGRTTRPPEAAWMEAGGYRAALAEVGGDAPAP
jgi:uncharacterized protein (DUF924 family)